jgi:hypothetical protein
MRQVARNLTDLYDGFLIGSRYLIHDRDPLFTEEFRAILKAGGVRTVKLPAQSPDLKGYASHCTSFVRFGAILGKRRRSESFWPCALTGGSAPGCSNRHSFLSLYA